MKKKLKDKTKEHKVQRNNLLLLALLSVIVFLAIELFSRIYELYKYYPPIDIPTHIFGGIALATLLFYIIFTTSIKNKIKFTLLLTFIGACIWEVFESLEELIVSNFFEIPEYLHDVFFWDGFADIIITSLGGIIAILLINHIKNKTDDIKIL